MNVAVLGLGKLGLPLAALLADSDETTHVWGVDPEWDILTGTLPKTLEAGVKELVTEVLDADKLSINESFKSNEIDFAFVVVPTPSRPTGEYNVRQVLAAVGEVYDADTVVIVSTVNPGDCRMIKQICSDETTLIYNPSFIALGETLRGFQHPDIVLIGQDDGYDANSYRTLLRSIHENQPIWQVMGTTEAELTKIALNTFLTLKISFANMVAAICEGTPETDARNVLTAIGLDTRIGSKYLYVGGPFGGPCFPRDTHALRHHMESAGVHLNMMHSIDAINNDTLHRILGLIEAQAAKHNTRNVGILGLTYKQGTPVTEHSLGIALKNNLRAMAYEVVTWDPILIAPEQPDMYQCVGEDMITVIANEDMMYRNLDITRALSVIDVWDVLPFRHRANVHRLGVGK